MIIRTAQRALLAVLLAVCVNAPAQTIDPATWGPYLPVIGTARRAGTDGYTMRWTWTQPGVELKEEYLTPSGRVAHTSTITRGDRPGTLRNVSSGLGGKEFSGTVQPDGSVLYVGSGLLKFHHLVGVAADGAWEVRSVKLKDGAIASVDAAPTHSRYLPVAGSAGPAAPGATTATAAAATGVAAASTGATSAQRPAAGAAATASATAAPLGASAPPASLSLRGLERFVGKRLVEMEEGATIDFSRAADGSVVIQLGYRDGSPEGRYVLAEPGSAPGTLEMRESAYGDAFRRQAEWKSDSMLSVSSKNARLRGWIRGYDFLADGDDLKVRAWGQFVTNIGAVTDNTFDRSRTYIAAPSAPSLEPAELARQHALNQRLFLASVGPKSPRPGRWLHPSGSVMWATSGSGLDFRDRANVLAVDGSTREVGTSAVLDPARGTWTTFEGGKAVAVSYATMGPDGSFEVRRLPELGVTPFDAIKAFYSVRFGATRVEVRRANASVEAYDWRSEGEALAAFGAAVAARRLAYPAEQQRAAQLAAEQARQQALQQAQMAAMQAQQELLDAQADAEFEAERQQRMAQWNQSRAASEQALADSVSRLNNTVANVEAQQAEYRARQEAQRLQQEAASRAADAQRAREATERQYEIARQFEAQQQAQAQQRAEQQAQAQQLAQQRPTSTASSSAGSAQAAGSASTRDRADGCVSPPVTSANKCPSSTGLRGRVTNQCASPVDVRMCFMTDTGWSCQSEYGVDPGDEWHPGDCRANGQVFYSVRYSDSSVPLATP